MSQKYTVHLEWRPTYTAAVEVEADDIADAHHKALEGASHDAKLWSVDSAIPYLLKIEAHAPAEAKQSEPDWTQQDASEATITKWMRANARGYTLETLAYAAHEHFARPFHIDVMRKFAAKAMSAGPG